jgi:hypothetical protein
MVLKKIHCLANKTMCRHHCNNARHSQQMLLAHTALPDRNHSHSLQAVPVHNMRAYEAVNKEIYSFLILALDAGEL